MQVPRTVPAAFAIVLAVALLVTGLWAASVSVPAFDTYNSNWDGASELRAEANAVSESADVLTRLTDYDGVSPNQTTSIILSPDQEYSDAEAARLRQFVRDGGTLVIAEDFGPHTNSLLLRIGASTRLDGRPVRDEQNFYRSPNITVATQTANSPLVHDVDRLTLNHGTVLKPSGADVLVETSPFAYVDANRSASLDQDEEMRQYPVVTSEQIGAGRVIVVSDASIFINAMGNRPGNEEFVRSVISMRSTVVLDQSHTGSVPPVANALIELQQSPALQGLTGIVLVGTLVFISSRLPAIQSSRRSSSETIQPPSADELRERIVRRHPDWDEERISRIVEGIMKHERRVKEDE